MTFSQRSKFSFYKRVYQSGPCSIGYVEYGQKILSLRTDDNLSDESRAPMFMSPKNIYIKILRQVNFPYHEPEVNWSAS